MMMKTTNEQNLFAWATDHASDTLSFDRLDIPVAQIEAEVDAALADGLIPEGSRQRAVIYLAFLLGMGTLVKRLEVLPWDERNIR